MKERILTALVLFAVVVGVLFFDPTGVGKYLLVTAAVAAFCWELSAICSTPPIWGLVGTALVLYFDWRLDRTALPVLFITLTAIGTLGLVTFARKQTPWVSLIPITLFFARGTSLALFALLGLSALFPPVLVAAIPIWAGDTAAIFAGKAFGKHKLAPSISPNKTWEGSIANLLAAIGAAATLGYFLKYPMDKMLLLGVSCGVIGQLGDLFESYLKRQAGLKDSGNLLPGHGGVFDRLDSLLMTAPFSYWILSSFLK